jgi:hypothetical protein
VRKSSPSAKTIRGNSSKYESYKEAFARIKLAQSDGYYLEAITIAESIICDRLISYLTRPENARPIRKDRLGRWPQFGALIKNWRNDSPTNPLCSRVDEWRQSRNTAVHSFAKSDPGMPTMGVEMFLSEAERTAANGATLAREVCRWQKEKKTK